MKKIVNTCWLRIVGKKKTPEEKMTLLAQAMVDSICMTMFEGKRLSYAEIGLLSSVFNEGIKKHLTDSIERHTLESEQLLRYHGQQIKEAEKALKTITNINLEVA